MNFISRNLFMFYFIWDAANGITTTPFKYLTVSAIPTKKPSELSSLKFITNPTESRFSSMQSAASVPETVNFVSTPSAINVDTTILKMDPVSHITTPLSSILPNASTLKPSINPFFSSTLSLLKTMDYTLLSTLSSLDLNPSPTLSITPTENYKFTKTQKPSTPLSFVFALTTNVPTLLSGSRLPLTVLTQPLLTKPLKSNKKLPARQYTASRTQSLNPITFTLNSIASTMVQQIYWLRYFFG